MSDDTAGAEFSSGHHRSRGGEADPQGTDDTHAAMRAIVAAGTG